MSLYNEAGRRRRRQTIGAAAAGVVIALVVGFALGRSSAGEPTAAEVVASLREELAPVRGGLDLLPTEYAEVESGAGGESAAVDGDLDRIRTALRAAAPDLRALDAERLAALEASLEALYSAVDERAPASRVEQLAAGAAAALGALPGGR